MAKLTLNSAFKKALKLFGDEVVISSTEQLSIDADGKILKEAIYSIFPLPPVRRKFTIKGISNESWEDCFTQLKDFKKNEN